MELKGNEMWWRRPSWLIQPEDLWPRQKSLVPTTETCEDERKVAVMTIAIKQRCGIEKVVEISKFNTLRKLYRVTVWVTRFCHNISRENKSDRRRGPLTLEEIVESEELWIRAAQPCRFCGTLVCQRRGFANEKGLLRFVYLLHDAGRPPRASGGFVGENV